ncbi:hypothetical protein Tco_1462063 [Tanacetum coccineum]
MTITNISIYFLCSIVGEPLSSDHVFDFPVDEPHPAYDYFAPGPLPGYVGNPNNTNGWIEADVPLLGELGELAEPIVEVEEQMFTPAIDMEEDLVVLFGNDNFRGDGLNEDKDDKEV